MRLVACTHEILRSPAFYKKTKNNFKYVDIYLHEKSWWLVCLHLLFIRSNFGETSVFHILTAVFFYGNIYLNSLFFTYYFKPFSDFTMAYLKRFIEMVFTVVYLPSTTLVATCD